jgi:hypothetical protein
MSDSMSHGRLYAFLLAHWGLAFVVFGISFVAFGLLSLNLLHMLAANFEFLSMYGVQAVRDGGLRQLLEIVASGFVAAACYLVFKLCEKVLVERLAALGAPRGAPVHLTEESES